MRYIIAAAMALTLSAPAYAVPVKHHAKAAVHHAAPVAAKPLPIFSFMGVDTETAFAGVPKDFGCSIKDDKPTERKCDTGGFVMAGSPLTIVAMNFEHDKLFMVMGVFEDRAYLDVLSALIAKYGRPTKIEAKKWESKGGATFDNQVSTWAFKGGNLELSSMGNQIGDGQFLFYSDSNAPVSEPVKVNF